MAIIRGRWVIVNNSAGVSGDQQLRQNLNELLDLSDLVFCSIEVQLCLEDLDW
jgi:hypothetical protein